MVGFMTQQTIKAILLDYGGVIAEEGFQNGLRAMAREQGLDPVKMMDVARDAVYTSGFVLGKGAEQAFWAAMREGISLKGDDETLTRRVLDGFTLRPWMIELVQKWRKQGCITGILSDQTHWLDWLNERDDFFKYFEPVFNSYYMGKGKRDPVLFHEIAEQLHLAPGEILFVDDMKSNVERAQAAGWQAIHYVDKRDFLERVKVLLPEEV